VVDDSLFAPGMARAARQFETVVKRGNCRPVQGFSVTLHSVFLDSQRYSPTIARRFRAGI